MFIPGAHNKACMLEWWRFISMILVLQLISTRVFLCICNEHFTLQTFILVQSTDTFSGINLANIYKHWRVKQEILSDGYI